MTTSTTTVSLPLLQSARIASPCHMAWDQMTGDETKRYCGECKLHVYNLSAMRAADAEALLSTAAASGERFCGAFYRRADGTILTSDCPVGVSLARRAARRVAAVAVAALSMIVATGAWAARRQFVRHNPSHASMFRGDISFAPSDESIALTQVQPMRTVAEWLTPKQVPTQQRMGRMMAGSIAPLPPQAPAGPIAPAPPKDGSAGGGGQ